MQGILFLKSFSCAAISGRHLNRRQCIIIPEIFHRSHLKRIMALEKGYETFGTTQPPLVEGRNHPRISKPTVILLGILSILSVATLFTFPPPYFLSTLICFSHIGTLHFAAPKNWNDFKNHSFAVGFDLTSGYGYY